ncbi:hypothetical protein IH601_09290 [Candidatus Bipolaricaulota bacterium]|nr:hypothetical protein [Candidatus Bipolaricaulota bacterium]
MYRGGQFTTLWPWMVSYEIHGVSVTNHIRIVANGCNFTVFVTGMEHYTITDT